MQYDKQSSDESENSGHLGAVAGLIIGIILGSLMLNTPGQDRPVPPTVNADAVSSYDALGNG